MDDDDIKGTKYQWCQGIFVNKISNNPPTVNVQWDAMPDVEGFEESSESEVALWEDKWRKKVRFAWRMDLDVELYDIFFSVDDAVIEDHDEGGEGDEDDMEYDVQSISSSSSICSGHDVDDDIEDSNSESD